MMRYHLGWVDERGCPQETSGGRRARPTLCLLACEGVGGDWHGALPAAAAIELMHNFSLIHDDIQDRSRERRNRPTVWKIWGQAQGINAGDAMHALTQLALLRLEERGIPWEKIGLVLNILSQTCLQICEGQYLDIDYEKSLDISLDNYREMIAKKTASLFECSLYLGSLLVTDNQAQILHLRSFGRGLGMAYQVQNDLLGIWGGDKSGRESSSTDIRYKKKALPIIYALQRVEGEDRSELLNIYSKARVSAKDVAQVLCILNGSGARNYTEGVIKQYHLQALQELERAGLSPLAQQELKEMSAFLLGQGS
ncbi:MAG TPA: polyprenyl synthetase family protein [Dehalococcoidia bacterium]|nr:polyprenyl synthetase family protein [Dehalococcoidia bacterium]